MKHRANRFVFMIALAVLSCAAAATINHQPSTINSPFTFVVIGDTRPASSHGDQPEVFKQMVAEIAALKPAFVLHTGDFVKGSSKLATLKRQYRDYTRVMDSAGVPVHLTIGNHEITGGKESREFFDQLLGETYYSFDYGNYHFVVLDCETAGDYHRIGKAQFDWLAKDLAGAKGKFNHIFVCAHEPLYPVDGHIGSSLDTYPEHRDRLAALLRKYGAVFFAGHEHIFDHGVYDGITQVITGGGGAPLHVSQKGTGDFHHYLIITVDGRSVKMSVARPGKKPGLVFSL